VQIAAYSGYPNDAAGDQRQAESLPMAVLPRIAFATSVDAVWPFDPPNQIHYSNKQLPSQRLARSVLSVEYGLGSPGDATSPLFVGAAAAPPGADPLLVAVDVELSGCVGGCFTRPYFEPPGLAPGQAAGFAIQVGDANRTWLNATTVAVTALGVHLSAHAPAPGLPVLATALGRSTWPVLTVYNSAGLPLVPFCFLLNGSACYEALDA
jgi:hypothetical protein